MKVLQFTCLSHGSTNVLIIGLRCSGIQNKNSFRIEMQALIIVKLFSGSFSQVAWIHIDRKMILAVHKHVIARIPRFSMSHDGQKTWQLNINGVRASDKGIYMCQVNTDPMISQIGYLQVVGEYVIMII